MRRGRTAYEGRFGREHVGRQTHDWLDAASNVRRHMGNCDLDGSSNRVAQYDGEERLQERRL